jgi:hypothetical protein
MVVDAVLVNDEWDLVLFRIKYLSPVVDKFYLGESSLTFSGLPKGRFFESRQSELEQLGVEVEVLDIAIPEELIVGGERWAVETFARNSLLERVCESHPDDLVLFADADEVPSRDQVRNLKALGSGLSIMSIPTQVCMRRANWIEYWPDQWRGKWGNGLVGRHWLPRIRRGRYPLVMGEPGAHLSYVGMTAGDIRRKYQAFSHGELDREELSSEDFLAFADKFHISHIGRALEPGAGLLTVVQEADFTELQREALTQFPHWIDTDPVTQPRHRRLVASWLLFLAIRGSLRGSLEDANAPLLSWRWLRHALAYSVVWTGWKTLGALGVLRLLRSSSTPKP